MKYIMKIDGIEVLLDQARMDAILDLLVGAEKVVEHYAGTGKGDDGGNYIKLIRPYEAHADMHVRLMHDGVYTARKLRTTAFDEVNKANR